MVDLCLAGTANGARASVALEECRRVYTAHGIDSTYGQEFQPHQAPADQVITV